MRLCYDNKSYPCIWKTKMSKAEYWYSCEPVRVKVTMPLSAYDKIMLDIKTDPDNKTLNDIFKFNIFKSEKEGNYNGSSIASRIPDIHEMWYIEAILDTAIITSKFRNGDVAVAFNLEISNSFKIDKSVVRDFILSELV